MTDQTQNTTPEATTNLTPDQEMDRFRGFQTQDGVEVKPEAQTNTGAAESNARQTQQRAGQTDDNDDDDDDDGDDEGKTPEQIEQRQQRRADAQKRINQATRRQRSAERERDEERMRRIAADQRNAELEARLQRLEKGLTGQPDKANIDPNAPNPASYDLGELDPNFIRDTARYETRKAIEEQRAADQAKGQQTEAQRAQEQLAARAREFAQKGSEIYDDFNDVVFVAAQNGEYPLTDTIGELVLGSEFGPQIVYDLAKNLSTAESVARMSKTEQQKWFYRQEMRLELENAGNGDGTQGQTTGQTQAQTQQAQPGRRTVTQAPPVPRSRVKAGGAAPQPTPETDDFAEFERLATANRNRR